MENGLMLVLIVVNALDYPVQDDGGLPEIELKLQGHSYLAPSSDYYRSPVLGYVLETASQSPALLGFIGGGPQGFEGKNHGRLVGVDPYGSPLLTSHQ